MEFGNKPLKEKGRLVIIDVANYKGLEEAEEGNFVLSEDELVAKKYPTPWVITIEEMKKILKEAGFSKIKAESKEPSTEDSAEENEQFGAYLSFRAEL